MSPRSSLCWRRTNALLSKIWGDILEVEGRTDSGMEVSSGGFPGVVPILQNWPSRPYPRPYYRREKASKIEEMDDWPVWLTDPPPSIMGRKTAIPVTMLSRYLDQRFWDGEVRRYGQQALKVSRHQWQGRSLKSNARHLFFDKRDVERAFRSKSVYVWMDFAKSVLRKSREYALADYMKSLTEGLVESHMSMYNKQQMARFLVYPLTPVYIWSTNNGEKGLLPLP